MAHKLILTDKRIKKIVRINNAVKEYFAINPSVKEVAAKDLMPLFIQKGIYLKDFQKGLYIRHLLHQMQVANMLHLLPDVKAIRRGREQQNNWFFERA